MGHRTVGTLGLVALLAGCPVSTGVGGTGPVGPGSSGRRPFSGEPCVASGCNCQQTITGCQCDCGSSASGSSGATGQGWSSVPIMTPQPTPTTQNLYAIDGVPGALVAVGQGGTIVRRQVSGWVLDVSPTQEDLFAVALLPYGKGVAVGRNGVMLRLGDGRWSLQPVLTSLPLNAVSMLESGAGFAVGGAAGGAGVALRFNGFSWWVLEPPDPLPALFGLAPAGGLDAWGVGVNGFVVRFPVAGDVVVDRVAQASILDSWATMDGVGFAVTVQGSILRQDGRTFVQDSVGHPALLGVAGYPHALAVGEQGTVLARVHGAWVNVPSPSRWNLWDVHVDEENVAWVVGDHGEIHRVQ